MPNPGEGGETAAQLEAQFARELSKNRWYHSFELPDGRTIEGHQTLQTLRARLDQFPVPADLSGKRVLDIGAWDGWFSFEMERRGAEVVACDIVERPGFLRVREALGSKVRFVLSDVYHLSPEEMGCFDIVLFLGVIYHLKHPLLALERVCALTTDLALVESAVSGEACDLASPPRMEFYENTEMLGRFDNWNAPNTPCLLALCRTAGFATVDFRSGAFGRAHVLCGRHWPEPPENPRQAAPIITGVVNQRHGRPQFDSRVDEYMSLYFKSDQPELTRGTVMPEMDGFGVHPAHLARCGTGWQVDCRIDPNGPPGKRSVRLRTSSSIFSEVAEFTVDAVGARPGAKEFSAPIEIAGVADSATWEDNAVRAGGDTCVSVWVRGLPDDAMRIRPRVRVGIIEAEMLFVSALDHEGLRQINVRLPERMAPGEYDVVVEYGRSTTTPAPLRVYTVPKN